MLFGKQTISLNPYPNYLTDNLMGSHHLKNTYLLNISDLIEEDFSQAL